MNNEADAPKNDSPPAEQAAREVSEPHGLWSMYTRALADGAILEAENRALREASAHPAAPQPASANPWRDALDDKLVNVGLDCLAPDEEPAHAIKRLIEWETMTALDPAVSAAAQALIERGNSGGSAPGSGDSADNSGGSASAQVAEERPPLCDVIAWICTDYDGHYGLGATQEEAKLNAGEHCTEFIPLTNASEADKGMRHLIDALRDATEAPTFDPEAVTAAEAADVMADARRWQPISTAPKETEVLVWFGPAVGVKSAVCTELHGAGIWSWCVTDGKFDPHPVRRYCAPYPTHWMPLPPPPAIDADRTEGEKP
jgi:hypothetical protein